MTPNLPLFVAAASLFPQPGTLTAEERALATFVDRDNARALTLLENAVNINSGTLNFEGVKEVGALFRAEFDALGFRTEWVDGAAFGRAGHLVAEHRGPGPKILLIGHLDTVFEPESPFQKFTRVDEHHATGPGLIDMKGGDVVMIQALRALHASGALESMNVVAVLTGDEESGGRPLAASRAALRAAAEGAVAAIGFEDGDGNPGTAVIARRGTTDWDLNIKGKPAHSSQIFNEENGYGAIFEAARILNTFRETLAGEPHLTFNPGVILGGTSVDYDRSASRGSGFGKTNVIAERAIVTGDLRALSPQQFAAARKSMEDIVSKSLPRTSATLTFREGYPPLAPTPGNERLLALYSQASIDLGTGPVVGVDPDRAGAADVSFVADQVGMILDGVGLMGSGGHTVNEAADLRNLPLMTKRAALLLLRLLNDEGTRP